MSNKGIKKFFMQSTFTGKLATVKKDESPRLVPIWFVLDDGNRKWMVGDIVFTTGSTSLKARNIQHNNRISICVDDQTPSFSFVTVYGTAKIHHYKQNELFKWAAKIVEWYMGKKNAQAYGRGNSGEGEVLVRIKPTKIIAENDIAEWD
jgi:PPOX class probable F420-dependent enzyme